MGEKIDQMKDCEDAVLNANFILPEERQKQKEQMFSNVKIKMQELSEGGQHLYDSISRCTNDARDHVNQVRYEFVEFGKRRERERE